MKIYIMRHGEAGLIAKSDAERSLTERGKADSKQVVSQLVSGSPLQIDKVLVSPYLRAQQTWDEISPFFAAKDVEVCDDITPYGQSENVAEYIRALIETQALESVYVVSHLPLVGYMVSEFVKDVSPPMFHTSGLVCIEYDALHDIGTLDWRIAPS